LDSYLLNILHFFIYEIYNILNIYAFLDLGGLIYTGYFTLFNSLVPPLLISLGGIIEGLFAEIIFDQKIHAFAVILFNAGFWLQLNIIRKGVIMLSCSDHK